MAVSKCSRCGSTRLADGAMMSPTRPSFRPSDAKFLTLETGDVLTKSTMCRECGLIEITGDINKLRRLLTAEEAPSQI